MTKSKEDIHWLPDADYNKAVFHFKAAVNDLLRENFDIYGLGAHIPGAVESITKGAEDFSLVCRGIDKPIKVK